MLLRFLALAGVLLGALTPHLGSARASQGPTLAAASVALNHETPGQVLVWLHRQPGVRWAKMGADGQTLDVRFTDGREAAILPRALSTVKLPSASLLHAAVRYQPSPGYRALVLEPFATELGLGPSAGDPETSRLKAAGFAVDSLNDTQVTVQSMARISAYNIVYMHTHSGSMANGDGIVATGEISSDSSGIGPYLQDGSVIQCTVSGTGALYYCITATYIKKYLGQFPAHAIVFLNGCTMLGATVFWQALHDKGAGVMISWDKEATSRDNYLAAAAFFAEMTQRMTVSGAITAEQAAGYGKSQLSGQNAKLGFVGDGSVTLAEAATSSPAPQPTPPTTTPATPAPPTSTPVPILHRPVLTGALRPRVAPGKRQIIAISSAPNTAVHVTVSFPTGETRSSTVTTDAAGHASYVFRQHPNRVTFGHVFAYVTLQAGAGTATTTDRLHYRIVWSKVDVSVLPRRQVVGKLVRIWVHTRAHRKVVIILRFPRGKARTLHARADASGWAEVPYRVAPYHRLPTNATVQILARVHLPKGVFHARTTFTIG